MVFYEYSSVMNYVMLICQNTMDGYIYNSGTKYLSGVCRGVRLRNDVPQCDGFKERSTLNMT